MPITHALVTRADRLAWDQGLRAYDAVQLAAALTCQDTVAALGYDIVFACCDKKLLQVAATNTGLRTWPEQAPAGQLGDGTNARESKQLQRPNGGNPEKSA